MLWRRSPRPSQLCKKRQRLSRNRPGVDKRFGRYLRLRRKQRSDSRRRGPLKSPLRRLQPRSRRSPRSEQTSPIECASLIRGNEPERLQSIYVTTHERARIQLYRSPTACTFGTGGWGCSPNRARTIITKRFRRPRIGVAQCRLAGFDHHVAKASHCDFSRPCIAVRTKKPTTSKIPKRTIRQVARPGTGFRSRSMGNRGAALTALSYRPRERSFRSRGT